MDDYLKLLVEFHKDNKRQGPGSDAETLKALKLAGLEGKKLDILDVGCGSGTQTMCLAKHTKGQITAVDLFPVFLEKLQANANEAGVSERITTLENSMMDLDFEKESFDLIWSEGAIYIKGFEKAIRDWRTFLKPGGLIVASEISWLTNERPKVVEDFWEKAYSEMNEISIKIGQMEKYGYKNLAHFILPEYCWMEEYYAPLIKKIPVFLKKQQGIKEVEAFIEEEKKEIAFYKKYKEYYGYVFYIGQRIE